MHSAVFGTSPEAAGEAAVRYLTRPDTVELRLRDLLDWAPGPDGRPSPHRLDTALVPDTPDRLQRAKAGGTATHDVALDALCGEIATSMQPGRLYLLGPGTTTALVSHHLGLPATTNGVDAILDGRVVAMDASEEELLRLLDSHPDATLLLGVIGGQGFLLGRGNQQLSAPVVERIGPDNVRILASEAKVAALDPPVLHVDIGAEKGSPMLVGYRRVETAPGRATVLRVTDR
jgi:predicted polyphosphate/ATP-dependent NAD kinase